MINKRIIGKALLFVLAIVAALVIRAVILGDVVKPAPHTNLTTQITSSITPDSGTASSPTKTDDKNYVVTERHEFEGTEWVVARIEPKVRNAADPAWIVFKKENGTYVAKLGPGTAFPLSSVKQLPTSVQKYLKKEKRVYND